MIFLEGEKVLYRMYLRASGRVKSTNHKKLCPQTANPQSATFVEGFKTIDNSSPPVDWIFMTIVDAVR